MISEDTKITVGTATKLIAFIASLGGTYMVVVERIAAVESRMAAQETLMRAAKLEELPTRLANIEAAVTSNKPTK